MRYLADLSMPAGFLVHCLNAATASSLACAIAVVLSRRSTWSLPARHALLVAALITSLTAPLVIRMFHLSSVWAIRVSEIFDQSSPVFERQSIGSTHQEGVPKSQISASIPVAETHADRLPIAVSPAVASVSVVPDAIAPAPIPEQPFVRTPKWARIIGTLVCGVWFAGIAVGVGRAILGFAKLRRWIQTVSVAESPALSRAARSAADGVGLRKEIAVYRSNRLPSPVTFGLLRPRIVVPAGIEASLPFDQLRAVIKHEMAHVARRDLWIGMLQQVAQMIHWWNPLVRLANRQLADLREQICDEIAIRGLAEPAAYASTLITIAERCSTRAPVPATLGIGASPARQLENRIRRIVSAPRSTCTRLSWRAAAGVAAVAVLTAVTILFAQVQIRSPAVERLGDKTKTVQADRSGDKPERIRADSRIEADQPEVSLHDLIQQMAAYEQAYLPFEMKVMETFRISEDISPRQRGQYPWADGRKHQRLMEYAQLATRIWRTKETHLIDDDVQDNTSEWFSDGECIVQASLRSSSRGDGKKPLQVYVNENKDAVSTYVLARPIFGVFCLSAYSAAELFSEAFQRAEKDIELAWDNGDAKLTFAHGHPQIKSRFVLWLSRTHAWHPIRLQRYFRMEDRSFFDEWEATKLVERGKQWRVVEGTHRYRDFEERDSPDAKIIYALDFKVLEAKYGSAVAEEQFRYQIPADAEVRDDNRPETKPGPLAKTREITVRVVDLANQAVPNASVRLRARRSIRELDVVTTDAKGVARSSKAPQDDVVLGIQASGLRPATWVVGNASDLRAALAPQTRGTAVDERGTPIAAAWITNEAPQVRVDGFAYIPERGFTGENWSDDDGRFELTSNLTLRNQNDRVPFIAIDPDGDRMAIRIVPAGELGQPRKLVLEPVRRVHGHGFLEGTTESEEIRPSLQTAGGETIASVTTRTHVTPDGLQVDFQLRLPPGDYVLKTRDSSYHAGFTIPFTVAKRKGDLDLGTRAVPATGPVALKGKPAPELEVQWRPGQHVTWEQLRGKVVVLDFWGTWCSPCIADMPMLMEIADQFRLKPVAWLSVHTPNLTGFQEFDRQVSKCQENSWNRRQLSFTTVIDQPLAGEDYSGKTSHRYGIAEWPTLIVIDQQGRIVGPVHKEKLAPTIGRLLGERNDKSSR